MRTYEMEFPSYNTRRYSKPWGARVRFNDNRPQYEFCGHWDGKSVVIDAEIGDVLAFGQKDYRGNKGCRLFFIAQPDGKLLEVNEREARSHWNEQAARASQGMS